MNRSICHMARSIESSWLAFNASQIGSGLSQIDLTQPFLAKLGWLTRVLVNRAANFPTKILGLPCVQRLGRPGPVAWTLNFFVSTIYDFCSILSYLSRAFSCFILKCFEGVFYALCFYFNIISCSFIFLGVICTIQPLRSCHHLQLQTCPLTNLLTSQCTLAWQTWRYDGQHIHINVLRLVCVASSSGTMTCLLSSFRPNIYT